MPQLRAHVLSAISCLLRQPVSRFDTDELKLQRGMYCIACVCVCSHRVYHGLLPLSRLQEVWKRMILLCKAAIEVSLFHPPFPSRS